MLAPAPSRGRSPRPRPSSTSKPRARENTFTPTTRSGCPRDQHSGPAPGVDRLGASAATGAAATGGVTVAGRVAAAGPPPLRRRRDFPRPPRSRLRACAAALVRFIQRHRGAGPRRAWSGPCDAFSIPSSTQRAHAAAPSGLLDHLLGRTFGDQPRHFVVHFEISWMHPPFVAGVQAGRASFGGHPLAVRRQPRRAARAFESSRRSAAREWRTRARTPDQALRDDAEMDEATRNGWMPRSNSRVSVDGASLVCSVLSRSGQSGPPAARCPPSRDRGFRRPE